MFLLGLAFTTVLVLALTALLLLKVLKKPVVYSQPDSRLHFLCRHHCIFDIDIKPGIKYENLELNPVNKVSTNV